MSRDEKSSVTRARIDRVVSEIARLMASGAWAKAEGERIASREGVTFSAVERWAERASSFLRVLEPNELMFLRARNVDRLDEVYLDASDEGDHKSRVSALAEQSKLLGLIVERHEVKGTVEQDWPKLRAKLVSALGDCCESCRAKVLGALEG